MEENTKPRRRWFRFSLRTMLVLVTVVCVYLGWAINWKRQRRDFLKTSTAMSTADPNRLAQLQLQSPSWTWLIGEKGYTMIFLKSGAQKSEIEEAERLFPEADVVDGMWQELFWIQFNLQRASPQTPLTNKSGFRPATQD